MFCLRIRLWLGQKESPTARHVWFVVVVVAQMSASERCGASIPKQKSGVWFWKLVLDPGSPGWACSGTSTRSRTSNLRGADPSFQTVGID